MLDIELDNFDQFLMNKRIEIDQSFQHCMEFPIFQVIIFIEIKKWLMATLIFFAASCEM